DQSFAFIAASACLTTPWRWLEENPVSAQCAHNPFVRRGWQINQKRYGSDCYGQKARWGM
ncbi:TPA: hypothetical protein ACIR09_005964, partial [Pseudomonas aeruginosa]